MPIYEYTCDKCGYKFEILRNINDDVDINCKKCNTGARRIFSSVPFIFGGTRWVGETKPITKTTGNEKRLKEPKKEICNA